MNLGVVLPSCQPMLGTLLGTIVGVTMGSAIRTHSLSKKKNSLSCAIGPPTLPPKWFTVAPGLWFPGVAFVK